MSPLYGNYAKCSWAWYRHHSTHALAQALAIVPVHDANIVEEGFCFGAEPANVCSAASHNYKPQPHTCMHAPRHLIELVRQTWSLMLFSIGGIPDHDWPVGVKECAVGSRYMFLKMHCHEGDMTQFTLNSLHPLTQSQQAAAHVQAKLGCC